MVDLRLMRLVAQCKIEDFSVPVNNLLKVDLLRYWQQRHKRYGTLVRHLLIAADSFMSWLHALIFR